MHGMTFSLSFRFHPSILDALAFYLEQREYRAIAVA